MKKHLYILLFFCSYLSYGQSSFSVSNSLEKSVLVEFKSAKKSSDIIFGAGVSFFYNKGNKGKDYSGFIRDFSNSYQTVIAKEGSIYFIVGNKINDNLSCTFRFGAGTVKRYINGKGLIGMPNEPWFVRQRLSEDLLCGISLQYNIGILSLTGGWDTFNGPGIGIGYTFLEK
jgi:hypothetical protein